MTAKTLKDLLVNALDHLLDHNGSLSGAPTDSPPSTWSDRQIAKFIGISPSHFSKVLKGQSQLSERLADSIAVTLSPGLGSVAQKQLKEHLLRTIRNTPSAKDAFHKFLDPLVAAADDWTHKKRAGGDEPMAGEAPPLLIIEYRDLPRAESQAPWQTLAKTLGEAVAAGVHVALFSPFGKPPLTREQNAVAYQEVRAFREQLALAARAVYMQIRAYAESAAESTGRPVSGEMTLFEAKVPSFHGFQTRIFLRKWRESNGNLHSDVWEWIAAQNKEEDVFLKKDVNAVPPSVVFWQFRQLAAYWTWRWSGTPDADKRLALPSGEKEVAVCRDLLNVDDTGLLWNPVLPEECQATIY
jgi:hypothetical protein